MDREQRAYIDALYREHFDDIYGLAYRHTGDQELSEDVTHLVFLTACQKPADVLEHPNPVGWLCVTALYMIRRECDRLYRRTEQSTWDLDQYAQESAYISFDSILPDSLAIPARDREILLLKYRDGLRHREIAERLGITELASSKRLRKALERCRKAYQEDPSEKIF